MAEPAGTELREQVRQLLALVSQTADRSEKRRLASRAFSLAQQAEAMHRMADGGQKPNSGVDPTLKTVVESNVQRFTEALYVETDGKMRDLYRSIMLREERWYGLREERLDLLMRLLRDCDGRMLRVSGRTDGAAGATIDETERLIDNLLDTQRFLLESLCNELSSDF